MFWRIERARSALWETVTAKQRIEEEDEHDDDHQTTIRVSQQTLYPRNMSLHALGDTGGTRISDSVTANIRNLKSNAMMWLPYPNFDEGAI